MTIKRKVLAVTVAGALSAAAAVPALALENEFHGLFRLYGSNSNFNGSTTGQGFFEPAGLDKNAPTSNFVQQRARLMYIAKASDDLKLVTHFEIDSRWGDASYTNSRNKGGGIGADTVNLETKSVYLDFNVPKTPVHMKVGLQPYNDAFKGVLFYADMAGVLASTTCGKLNSSLGYFRFNDVAGTGITLGQQSRDMFALDASYQATQNLKVGGAYYVINDDRNSKDPFDPATGNTNPGFLKQQGGLTNITHNVGINAEAKLGIVTVDGFFLYQFGNLEAPVNRHVSAFAGNVGARAKLGPGTARTEFLYVSGEKSSNRGTTNAFQSINSVDTEHGFYDGDMQILFRDPYATTIDNSIVYSSNNKDQGVVAGFIGYDMPITPKLSASLNAGFAATAKDNANKPAGRGNNSNYLGTEISTHVDYKVYENLTAIGRGAYVFLGDYYKGVALNGQDPDNPYMLSIILNYAF